MVLKSEGLAIKNVTSPPRDKKYAIVAYARLMSEYADEENMTKADNGCLQTLASGLIDLASGKISQFSMASSLEKSGEELLVDGAID